MKNKEGETVKVDRAAEWRRLLGIAVSGLLVFETLTGLSIYLLPFSIPNQFIVLVHTGVGLLFIAPFAWYQFRHWLVYRSTPMTHVKLTGYIAMAVTVLCVVSGVILTIQALFGTKISYAWDKVHIASTLTLIAFTVPHIVSLVFRNRSLSDFGYKARRIEAIGQIIAAEKRYGWGVAGITMGLFALVGLLVYGYKPVQFQNTFPSDYAYVYGKERPFAPSLAQTDTGGAFDPRSLAGSESCGTAGCHSEIVEEWQVSAHRYAAMDAAFQAVQNEMGKQNGPESTRYCGGCHDPISLFSGTKNLFVENLTALEGYQEGVSCIVCHAIKETDVKGNANYTIHQPRWYIYELKEGDTARFLRDFLIRSYPRYHVKSLQHRLFKSPEFCAACHKQFIDQEVNNVGWVQLQNQYDNWRKSRWNHPGDAKKTIECRECHMPLVDSNDPAQGDALDYNRSPNDDKHRSHRFIAANQFIPALHNLPDAQEQIALTERWLRGEIEIPEIADKWTTGSAVPIQLEEKVIVVYVSMWNSTEAMIETMVETLLEERIEVSLYNLSNADIGEIAKDLVDSSAIVFGAPTVLGGMHPLGIYAANLVKALRPPLKYGVLLSSYGWGGGAVKQALGILGSTKLEVVGTLEVNGPPSADDYEKVVQIGKQLADKIRK